MFLLKNYSFARTKRTNARSLADECLRLENSGLFGERLLFRTNKIFHQHHLRSNIPDLSCITDAVDVSKWPDHKAEFLFENQISQTDNEFVTAKNAEQVLSEMHGNFSYLFPADSSDPNSGYITLSCSVNKEGIASVASIISAIKYPQHRSILSSAVVDALNEVGLLGGFRVSKTPPGDFENVHILDPVDGNGITVFNFPDGNGTKAVMFQKNSIAEAVSTLTEICNRIELEIAQHRYVNSASFSNFEDIRSNWLNFFGNHSCNLSYFGKYKEDFYPLEQHGQDSIEVRFPIHTTFGTPDQRCITTVVAGHSKDSSFLEVATEGGEESLQALVDSTQLDFQFCNIACEA